MTLKSEMNEAKSLLNYYKKLYKSRYSSLPVMNSYKAQWGFKSMVDDLGLASAKQVIEFYFDTDKILHPTSYLFNNYDSIWKRVESYKEDELVRKELRRLTEIRVREWENAQHGT